MTQITLPNQNVTGPNLWSQVENNDKAIRDVVNGDLDNGNIATNANIAGSKLLAGSVGATQLGTGAVTEAKIGSGAVTSAKIGSGAVTSGKVGTGAVGTAQLVDSSVTSAKIADGTIVNGDVANGTLSPAKFSPIFNQAALSANLQISGWATPISINLTSSGTYLAIASGGFYGQNYNEIDAKIVTFGQESFPCRFGGNPGGAFAHQAILAGVSYITLLIQSTSGKQFLSAGTSLQIVRIG